MAGGSPFGRIIVLAEFVIALKFPYDNILVAHIRSHMHTLTHAYIMLLATIQACTYIYTHAYRATLASSSCESICDFDTEPPLCPSHFAALPMLPPAILHAWVVVIFI